MMGDYSGLIKIQKENERKLKELIAKYKGMR